MNGTKPEASTSASSWRQLIQVATAVLWPSLADGPTWIESQVHAESGGDPRAISSCGALGLLQLMPGTAAEVGVTNALDPAENLRGGITYLRRQYEALEARRVPSHIDRLLWAFAAYNAGRGYVLRALGIAEMDARGHRLARDWWSWDANWRYLFHREASVNGRWADYHQTVAYVERIRAHALSLGVASVAR